MLDIKLLREDIHAVATALLKRGYEIDSARFQALEDKRKALQTKTQGLQNQRNERSKAIGQAKAQGQDIQPLLDEVADLGEQLKLAETDLSGLQAQIHDFVSGIPNLLHDSVPEGKDEADNIEIKRWGEQPQFDFEIKDHVDLGGRDQQMDFEAATRITGSRFVVLKKDIARMHRALIQLMLDSHINEHQYEEVYVPYIVNSNSLYGTGQLPKFADDLFKLNAEQEFYLIPTAEVPVTNLVSDSIVDESSLPLKYTAHTPCFRSEAGSYGRDTRGLIRQHQFEKVEMVQLVKPDDSWQALESMLGHAEAILQKLQLPYRVVTLCAGDTGFSSSKTYDIEVWLPAQEAYREISSVSNMQDFQARRMQARYRNKDNNKPELLHSLNGSGLAVGRTLLAILENHQQADGSVRVPEVLQPYMGGVDRILIEH